MTRVLAELTYEFGDKRWSAFVTKGTEPDGTPAFVLEIESGGRKSVAGTFTHGKALVKWARNKAKEKFSAYTPTVDTLRAVADRAPASIVPECYLAILDESVDGLGRGYPECPGCPYRSRCGEFQTSALPTQTEEELSVEEKREKLRALVAAKWGEESS